MQIAQVLAGFTLGGADLLRRAMGKKKADVMAQQRAVFVEGAAKNDVPASQAGEIFDLMEKFAEYGFNKSHSAAYALITYHTAYLKAHYKVEFMAGLLTNDKDASDKVSKGIRNARKIGIEVLAPSANLSVADFDVVDGKILFGMAGIRGVGENAVEAIVEARRADGKFKDLFDFCERVDLKRVNKKVLEALIKSGAFDFARTPRARMIACLDLAVDRAQQAQKDRAAGQGSLFDLLGGGGPKSDSKLPPELASVEEWSQRQLLANEKDCLGFYVSGHPLDRYVDQIEQYTTATIEQLREMENYARVTIAGIQTALKVRPFKSGEGKMAIIQFEDHTGSVEVLALGDDYNTYETLLCSDEPLLVQGTLRVEKEEDRVNVSVRIGAGRPRRGEPEATGPFVTLLADVRSSRARAVEIGIAAGAVSPERMAAIGALLREPRHAGQCDAFLRITTADACDVKLSVPGVKIAPDDDLQDHIQRIFGGACTVSVV
jgi:DNA polymerase-3 subunit alpha